MKIKLGDKSTHLVSKINKINGWQNRAVYGVAALITQPFFDYYNPNVDETTRKYSVVKTLVKIGVGATVGVLARAPFQKLGEHLCDKGAFDLNKLGIKNLDKKKFSGCVGNVFAIAGAVLAMFSVDIFVSNKLLSYFNKKIAGGNQKK